MKLERAAFTLSNDSANETWMLCALRHGYQVELDVWQAIGTEDFKRLDISSNEPLPDGFEVMRGIGFEINKEAYYMLDSETHEHDGHSHTAEDLWRQIILQFIGGAFTAIPQNIVSRATLMQMQLVAMDGHFMHIVPVKLEAEPADFFHVPDYMPGGE